MRANYKAPSVKSLMQIKNVSEEKAKLIRRLLKGEVKTTSFDSVQRWERQCYNRPPWIERAMCAANEIIGGYGVESLTDKEESWKAFASYVNMGDTYDATLVYFYGSDNFYVKSWGDVVEANNL